MENTSILFIGHEATRTGAPILLLNFLRWLKDNEDVPFEVMLRLGGPLQSAYEALAPVHVLENQRAGSGLAARAFARFLRSRPIASMRLKNLAKKLVRADVRLIFSNTIANSAVLRSLPSPGCPIICYVHELEHIIRRYGLKEFEFVEKRITHYIAASKAVKDNLVANHGIPAHRIDVVHASIRIQPGRGKSREQIRRELGMEDTALVVCASGTMNWRKAPDLFVQLACAVRKRGKAPPIRFLWVGGRKGGGPELPSALLKLSLEQQVIFLGEVQNPIDYFAACDIFALVSREDPFPLVMLEAASLGKSLVSFDDTGGAKEFIEADCGFVVPYLDVEAMADKILELCGSEDLRRRLGERARQKVRQRHDIEAAAPKILEIIRRFLPSSG